MLKLFVFQGKKTHIIIVSNGPHIISLPVAWWKNETNFILNQTDTHISRLENALHNIVAFAKKRHSGKSIYFFMDTLPLYVDHAGSQALTGGKMFHFSLQQQYI